ncbi:tRNA 2-thiouridine(34) synthase MnmA [Flammeovirga kamogawensis]|uniref:tRNA-specific 2-thiouridylase MnmA n=1 Tax=Flammeovirga kamogawensis TaxID=373891 RepID=A0ABX8GSA5_9BACT|nr:tRNA 2-thiouridine(34) synthase MnmA [Flammeovirga kamogawensis]MBB6462907.1 tRNA-specific 2-thiouridylase [Flammeovirga kamogawensis]QWG06436.1 tRNA 2-thiouridine(34) synthase MnmA [Flammeovirga kamogawensis]TRX68267.1 tRNA 2-thiouridine(34) synthase MnmA [Flammeovirga kamogawensis]
MAKRVVVGLSGGVDSSVAAHLLVEQGYEVIGLFMINWHDGSVTIQGECPWIDDSNDALLVANKLNIPFQSVDLSEQYKERIVDYMFSEYEAGRTPNPDVLCNREVKFDVFMDIALSLGADYVAMGHYCRKDSFIDENGKEVFRLLAGVDGNKDQSYFLSQLSQEQLSKALFPIGELTKPQVRDIAAEQDLITANKKDSQGLCFIGKVKLPDFLKQQLLPKKGNIVEVSKEHQIYADREAELLKASTEEEKLEILTSPYQYKPTYGKKVGDHQGAHYYTIGQRKGLGVGGTPLPLFVIATDTKTNTIYTGQGDQHPGLNRQGLKVNSDEIHWVRTDLAMKVGETREYMARIRYRQPLEKVTLYMKSDGLYCVFENKQSGISAGQFITWYTDDELIGSGVIAG